MEQVSILSKKIGDKAWNDFQNDLCQKIVKINNDLPPAYRGFLNNALYDLRRNKALEKHVRREAVWQFLEDFEDLQGRVEGLEWDRYND